MLTPIFGVDDDMRGFVQRYAARGYVVVAPDLFWRTIPGPLARTGADREKALTRKKMVDVEQVRGDVKAAAEGLRAIPECNGKVAAIGFCFGGRYAMLAAADGTVDATGTFHASEVGLELEAVRRVNVPVSMHYGDSDPVAPMSEVDAVAKALRGKHNAELFVYPGAQHSFSIPGNAAYDPVAAQASEDRVFAMLDRLKA